MATKCPRCEFTSNDDNEMCVHVVEECKNIFTYCDDCDVNFLNFMLLKEHKLICEDFIRGKYSNTQRKKISKKEKGMDMYQCYYCDEYFPIKSALKSHLVNCCIVVKAMPLKKQEVVKKSQDYKINCRYCENDFDTPEEYKNHHAEECDIKDLYFEEFMNGEDSD